MNDAGTGTPPEAGFDLGPEPAAKNGAAYRVLARKYRPASFEALIGQDAMVRTLSNAFESGRIPQAWILTGVRGVGKTTTARILARGLNYEAPGVSSPTIHMPTLGTQCQAIMESRHVDVIEMDAASHNGVDDVRQINDAVRYAPVSARYKVYILDEVHMLSTAAFNALLKTLEEPPPHVKFVFATTEIRKVPVTILSRCQRFDLRRVEAGVLVNHLAGICTQEAIAAEPEALALIARAAEGSVRDSLSLLDQAISHASGAVRAEDVRSMLGLADRARVIDLFEALMRGDAASALGELRQQYDAGADPAVALVDLADFTHFVTRIKVVPSVADDPAFIESERTRGRGFASGLSMRVLSRTWQMLLKGIPDVQSAAKPLAAAEMLLVRIAYAADLPSPEDVIRSLQDGGGGPGQPPGGGAIPPSGGGNGGGAPRQRLEARGNGGQATALRMQPAPTPTVSPPVMAAPQAEAARALQLGRFEDVIALAAEKRDLMLKGALERDVRLVKFADGTLEIALEPGASKVLGAEIARKVSLWTGRIWRVDVVPDGGAPTLRAQADAQREQLESDVTVAPLVQAVLRRFPGAQIVRVQPAGAPDPAVAEVAAEPAAIVTDESGDVLPYGSEDFGPEPPPVDDPSFYGADEMPDED